MQTAVRGIVYRPLHSSILLLLGLLPLLVKHRNPPVLEHLSCESDDVPLLTTRMTIYLSVQYHERQRILAHHSANEPIAFPVATLTALVNIQVSTPSHPSQTTRTSRSQHHFEESMPQPSIKHLKTQIQTPHHLHCSEMERESTLIETENQCTSHQMYPPMTNARIDDEASTSSPLRERASV